MKTIKEDVIKNVMAKLFGVDASAIDDDSSMDNVAAWDSLTHLKLVLALEEELGIAFTEEESIEIMSYALIKEVVKAHEIVLVA